VQGEATVSPGLGHYQKTLGLPRALAFVSLAIPLVMLLVGGVVSWQTKQREAWDKTTRLVDLLYESTSKLFETQSLAIGNCSTR
jgi:two-component system, NtrC family, sensor kinase